MHYAPIGKHQMLGGIWKTRVAMLHFFSMAQGSKLFPLPQKAHHFLEQKTAKPIMLFVAWIFFPKTNIHPERIIGSQNWCFVDPKEPC